VRPIGPAAVALSLRAIQRIWEALQPHRIRTFKQSNNPAFAEKVKDIVGLYCTRRRMPWCCRSTRNPRSRRSTAPSPVWIKPGKCGTMTHDYKRHQYPVRRPQHARRRHPRPLYAAHTHREFIRFLNAVDRAMPPGKLVQGILDKRSDAPGDRMARMRVTPPVDRRA
jgi:hypothetical protein